MSHDGTFNAESAWHDGRIVVHELEFGGPPWKNGTFTGNSRRTTTPTISRRRRWSLHGQNDYRLDVVSRVRSVYDPASPEGAVENVVFPGRRPLSCSSRKLAVVVQNRERLGGSVVQVIAVIPNEVKPLALWRTKRDFVIKQLMGGPSPSARPGQTAKLQATDRSMML